MEAIKYLSMIELEAGMDYIRQSPMDDGRLKMIARRPVDDEREVIERGELHHLEGLIGDNWKQRGSKHSEDGSANSEAQITVMNARTIELLAQDEERASGRINFTLTWIWDDQSPAGTHLAIGSAIIEVTAVPHTGCKKFSARFGVEALKFVNSPEGKRLHLRGINTKIVQPGIIQVGDVVKKISHGTLSQ
jgi:MOSC domain-containing protein YiiM